MDKLEANENNCLVTITSLPTKEFAFDQGGIAADQAYSIHQNPYSNGIIAHAWWEAGHSNSTDELCGRYPIE